VNRARKVLEDVGPSHWRKDHDVHDLHNITQAASAMTTTQAVDPANVPDLVKSL
jgi:hypothetical protein